MPYELHRDEPALSQSARENGWATYPADFWHEQRAPRVADGSPFWPQCARKYGGPVLDLCCGNGRYAIHLAELGYEVVGVDLNAGLVERARAWAAARSRQAGRHLNVEFRVGDVVRLMLEQKFRLAILPGWSFQVLLTQEDQVAFLRGVHEHLKRGGALAMDLFIPFYRQRGLVCTDGVYEWPPNPAYHSGAPRTYDPVTQVERLKESNLHPIRLRHTSLAELKLLFALTGFEIVELLGDDRDLRPFTGKTGDDYTLAAARR